MIIEPMKFAAFIQGMLLVSVTTLNSQMSGVLRTGQTLSDVQIRFNSGEVLSSVGWSRKAVLIDFWASWCSNCIEGFPRLKQMQAKYDSHLEIISINVDEPSSKAKADTILHTQHLPWKEADMGGGLANPVLRRFQRADHGSLPMYVLIGPDRVIRYSGWGGEAQTELTSAVASLAKESYSEQDR